jgi:lipopolysaccharide export system protein LptA
MEKKVMGFPMTVFILGGGAWVYHKNVRLAASEIEIVGEDAIKAELKGSVTVEDKENGSFLSAARGSYDKLSEKIFLEGRPRLIYTSKDKQKTRVSAGRIVRNLAEGITILEGKIYMTNPEFAVVGEDAVYSDSTKEMVMKGSPMIFSSGRFLTGDKLTYNTETGEVALVDNSVFLQESEETKDGTEPKIGKKSDSLNQNSIPPTKVSDSQKQPGGEEEKIRVRTVASANRMIHSTKSETPTTTLEGNAVIYRPSSEFFANKIQAKGEGQEDIEASGNVIYRDLENRTNLTGGFLEHFQGKNYSHLTGQPKIEVLKKDSEEIQTTVLAVEIERFIDREEIVARGDVRIETESAKARGEYATYFESEEKIVLEGDPSLEKDGKILHSGKIILYPKDDRVILSEGLNLKGSE